MKFAFLLAMKGINTPGQALKREGVASFSAPRGEVCLRLGESD